MNNINTQFDILKERQFSSNQIKKEFKKLGMNIRVPVSKLCNLKGLSKVYSAFRKKFNSEMTSQVVKVRIHHLMNNVKNYRGIRHKKELPVRGQRTHTNAKTRRLYKVERRSVQEKAQDLKQNSTNLITAKTI